MGRREKRTEGREEGRSKVGTGGGPQSPACLPDPYAMMLETRERRRERRRESEKGGWMEEGGRGRRGGRGGGRGGQRKGKRKKEEIKGLSALYASVIPRYLCEISIMTPFLKIRKWGTNR